MRQARKRGGGKKMLRNPINYSLTRDRFPDVCFSGILLGAGYQVFGETWGSEHSHTYSATVCIYQTVTKCYVVHVHNWDAWEANDSYKATICTTPIDVLKWLIEEDGGRLNPASLGALREAAKNDIGFVPTKHIAEKGEKRWNEDSQQSPPSGSS